MKNVVVSTNTGKKVYYRYFNFKLLKYSIFKKLKYFFDSKNKSNIKRGVQKLKNDKYIRENPIMKDEN